MKENHLKNKSPKKRKQVKLTRKELEELMGIHRDTFRKKNGVWRRK